ncbi:tRNA uridine-5-carboxymethylaminomethyl(34) synthesis GTPase MnmE [Anaerovibrio sp.]|uniref:tRNA uridine-5-carboxymethylaminomethyl(34) synthesis GTPase MnmE n=1 Tax=Anaerovibrio sp. TaxID=1872532 RepID=UPI003F145E53
MQQDYTISAIATAIGEGGIGIVRLSGERAVEIADRCFRPSGGHRLAECTPRLAVFGRIYDEEGRFVDEAVCIVMKGPHSYTCEDVVELQCHGGSLVLRQVLGLTYRLGARPAEPGEFTKRAFLNGRLDLSQAQSVMDMIQARTKASLEMAAGNLQGRLSEAIGNLRQEILEIIAHLEASIDFPEDDIEEVALGEAEMKVEHIYGEVQELLSSADRGRILRDGLRTAIIGRPNAGKSSLMNLMLGQERAIVTDVPGTTRDSIEEYVNIGGIPLKLADTAGIRDTDNLVEQIGVERAHSYAREAELVLAVFDGSDGIQVADEPIWQLLSQCRGRIIVILNKSDLAMQIGEEEIRQLAAQKEVENLYCIVSMSAKSGTGLEVLEKEIQNLAFGGRIGWQESVMVSDARQQDILRQALLLLEQTRITLMNGMSEDFVVIDLRSAWEKLGEITGDTIGEDIIDEIFSRFCIGK